MVAHKGPQQRKPEEGTAFHKLHVLGMNDDLWDRVRVAISSKAV